MKLFSMHTGKLEGEIKCPPSKSYTIRAVIAAMLAEGASTIKDPLYSADTSACILAAKAMGASLEQVDHSLKVSGVVGLPKCPSMPIDTMNSGTTFRLMTAVASLCDCEVTLTGDSSVKKRPIQPLLDALQQLGASTKSTKGYPPVSVQGPLTGGTCTIRGDISSQFISALLMALPCAKQHSNVNVIGQLRSTPYIDLTLHILDKFQVRVTPENHLRYIVPGDQTYKATQYTVEGDYSSAAFLLAAAALTESNVTIQNLFRDSKQADKKFIEILKAMGVNVDVREQSVTVKGSGNLRAIEVDLGDSPDLLPITAVLGACAKGRTRIFNSEHCRLKECDRIKAMCTELRKMGANVTENKDGLDVVGGPLKGALLDGWRDHRIVMSLAIAGLRARGRTEITNREYVGVTFPTFVKLMNEIGANIK